MTNVFLTEARLQTEIYYSIIDSPLGNILLAGRGNGIALVSFLEGTEPTALGRSWKESRARYRDAEAQLGDYFRGTLKEFDLELDLQGTEFQRSVWGALRALPYGRTATYAEIAIAIGRPTAVRAVGSATGANPVPILVPCHRVIGSDGRLTGYRGGLEIKRRLLDLERSGK